MASTNHRSGRRRLSARGLAAGLALAAVGATAAATITWLNADAARDERAVSQLSDVSSIVSRLDSMAWATLAGVPAEPTDLDALLIDLERTVDDAEEFLADDRLEALTEQYAFALSGPGAEADRIAPLHAEITDYLDRQIVPATDRAGDARARTAFGTWVLVLGAVALIGISTGRVRRQARTLESVAASHRADQRLRRLVAASPEFVLVVRLADGVITYLSPAAAAVLGTPAGPVAVGSLLGLIDPDDLPLVAERLAAVRTQGDSARFECRVVLGGVRRHMDCTISNHHDDPEIAGIVVNAIDVTERAELTSDLSHQANHDSLTGLLNRQAFLDTVNRAVDSGHPVAVLLVDLDSFKEVNDTLGHAAGDRVLTTAAARLALLVRHHDVVARLGGDEFAVVLLNTDANGAHSVARRVLDTMASPIETGDANEILLSASVGIALGATGIDAPTLLKRADAAMYEAKQAGRARYATYAPELEARFAHRVELRSAIESGMANREFSLQYQPIHAIESGDLVGFEALLRWQRPDGSTTSPGEFLPVAEASGQIIPLGRWVVHAAMRQLGVWRDAHPGLGMAINVSPRQLGEPGFVDEVAALLATHKLDPAALTFEITETMLVDDPDRTAARLHALKLLGVRLAIDDYGAGHAAIGFLLRFPIDVVKFDRQLIASIDETPLETEAMIRSITSLAHALHLETVAEGIERADQLAVVSGLGCTKAQGYHLARPMYPDRAEKYLLAHSPSCRGAVSPT